MFVLHDQVHILLSVLQNHVIGQKSPLFDQIYKLTLSNELDLKNTL
jgi:hypothetical protein